MMTKEYRPKTQITATSTQYAVVRKLIEDNNFFTSVATILNEQDFSGVARVVISNIKEYFRTNYKVPTWKELYQMGESKRYGEKNRIEYETFIKEASQTVVNEAEVNVEVYIDRAKRNAFERFGSAVKEFSRSKGYNQEEALRMVADGMNQIQAINGNDNGTLTERLARLKDSNISLLSTGLNLLDEHCKGGVLRGCCGVIVAGTGVGKTTLGTIMSVGIAKKGTRCLYYFCEGTEQDQDRKILAALSGEYANSLSGAHAEEVLNRLTTENGTMLATVDQNLITRQIINGYTTVEDLIMQVKMLELQGKKPDVVFIDYIACLRIADDRAQRVTKEYELYEQVMRRIEAWAQQENLFVWVLAQTNRNGLNKEAENGCGDIEGSKRILNPSSINLFLKKEVDDRFRLRLEKCRNASLTNWNITMNNGTCQLEMSETNDNDDYLAKLFEKDIALSTTPAPDQATKAKKAQYNNSGYYEIQGL